MRQTESEIGVIIAAVIILLLALLSFIVLFLVIYQRRRHRHEQELLKMQEKHQQEILKTQLEIREQTLQHIAQEIHDNIGQVLSLAKLYLNTLQPNTEGSFQKINEVKELISKAIYDLRSLSRSLNAANLENVDLEEAIRFQLDIIERSGSYHTKFSAEGEPIELDVERKMVVIRTVQELLNNAIKYSKAQQIEVYLSYLPHCIILRLNDNGVGFDKSILDKNKKTLTNGSSGIMNIFNRAKLIGAQFNLETAAAKGTKTELTIPLVLNDR